MRNLTTESVTTNTLLLVKAFIWTTILAFTLSGCGGDSGSGQVASQARPTQQTITEQDPTTGTSTVKYVLPLSPTVNLYSDMPFSTLDRELAKATTSDQMDASVAKQASLLTNAPRAAGTVPAACRWYRFIGTPGCLVVNPTRYGMPSGTTVADIAPVVPGCTEMVVGSTRMDTTPVVGANNCYQFVFNANATISSQIRVPSDFVGIAELFYVLANGTGLKVTDAASPNNPFSLGATSQYYRAALMLRSGGGTSGAPMSVGIGVPAPSLAGAVNDDPSRPVPVAMNQTITIPPIASGATQSQYYYFYPTTAGQTSAELLVNFTANQTASYWAAQMSATGAITTNGSEIAVSQSNISQTIPNLFGNAVGATTKNGLLIRVGNKTAGTPISDGFSLRAGVMPAPVTSPNISNTEGLTRIYARSSGFRQAYASMGTILNVNDANGNPVAGEQVQLNVYNNESNTTSDRSLTRTTDANGQVSVILTLPPCIGVETNHNTIFSFPGDYWIMQGQRGAIEAVLPNRSTIEKQRSLFYKVCSETYRGQHSCGSNSTDLWCQANTPWPQF